MKPLALKTSGILLFFLFSLPSFAQNTITGKVINVDDKKPIGYAAVFLSNSIVGTRTTDDGTFTLTYTKTGQYDMVVSCIGFETNHQSITINGDALNLHTIELKPKINQLKEVVIGVDANREKYLAVFKREFLGLSENAQHCKILNPEVLNFNYDTPGKTLNANTDDYLIVENKALGYKIHYQVNKFSKDYGDNSVYYEGPVLFEEMKGKPSEEREWIKKRLEVYKGSDMHFLRSVFTNQVEQQGFKVMRLIIKPNPARPSDAFIDAKLRFFSPPASTAPHRRDSLQYWSAKAQLPKAFETLISKPLAISDFVKPTDNPNMLALKYTDYLYIMYTAKRDDNRSNSRIYTPLNMPNYPTTVVTLNTKYAVFDRNGILINPANTTFDGAWGLNKVAELLPVDYTPTP